MNKQGLIENIRLMSFAYPDDNPKTDDESSVEYKQGYNAACIDISAEAKRLDEPQKLILPKCAEQWIEGHCAPSDVVNLFIEVTCATDSDGFIDSKWRWSTDFYEWLANDADTLYILCDALRYGYEVEEEPRWIVKYIPPFVDEFRYYSMDDEIFDITESSWTSDKEDAYPFTEKEKAEAVALLVDGSVEEV